MISENFIYLKYLFFIICGYLLGSIMFGYIVPKIFKDVDTRKVSNDGNPGAANAFIHGGIVCGSLTLLLELLKGFIPIFVAKNMLNVNNILFSFVMIAPVIGHAYPLYLRFSGGGKCIAVSFGCLLGLFPYLEIALTLALWYLFFSLIIIIKPHSLRTVITFLCFIITTIFFVRILAIFIGCFIISSVVIIKHITSLKKMEETEVRFAFRKH